MITARRQPDTNAHVNDLVRRCDSTAIGRSLLGGIFFGESMFALERDASKVALVHLIARMRAGNFMFVDAQFTSEHLNRFGAIEISRSEYQSLLKEALGVQSNFNTPVGISTLNIVLNTN